MYTVMPETRVTVFAGDEKLTARAPRAVGVGVIVPYDRSCRGIRAALADGNAEEALRIAGQKTRNRGGVEKPAKATLT